MDVALSNAIVNTATQMASAQTSDAVNIAMLKKALDMQQATATNMIDAMVQAMPQPQLATSGTLGTQLNTYA
ncbi:MAG: YjfB family protein [Nitrospirota bacterium]|jgi:hypothetical protein